MANINHRINKKMEKKKFILPSPLFSAAMATQTYGAVPPANDHYDVNNTRYLDQTPFQWGRFFRAACPILIALLIFGFFGYGMSHGYVLITFKTSFLLLDPPF